eukprot:CAMPEP_0179290696 /NCGR_PEP_ID=MMETSP0797-20121207/41951_1 /TAXON_ID=47934 /ORGANISM="Dinophysis acuminata, Strain DAEP01" /LENGTH=562 /DNA_ID=CAMNT_0020999741 /DNA_START=48 /DNA_END=1732 /DNA_ORIENTATION=-
MAVKVAAWASWAEWQTVYSQLSSKDAAERVLGVQHVLTWRTRSRLPVAVDMTGTFVEVMLNDPALNPATKAPRSQHELRLMYGMAIVRLVNGIVDVAQQSTKKRKISDLAKTLDWPQLFVELRHQVSHQAMPSLELLRLAAQEATWLLFARYWEPQLARLQRRGHAVDAGADEDAAPRPIREKPYIDRKLRGLVAAVTQTGPLKRSASTASLASQDGETSAGDAAGAGGGASPNDADAEDRRGGASAAANRLAALGTDEAAAAGADLRDHAGRRAARRRARGHGLVRQLLAQALGLPGSLASAPGPSADITPSLRNISDVCTGSAQQHVPEEGCPDDAGTPTMEEAERATRWLEVLLPPAGSADGNPQEAGPPQTPAPPRIAQAVADLAPLLRRATLRHIAAAAASSCSRADLLAERAERVWRLVDASGADAGAGFFAELCAGRPLREAARATGAVGGDGGTAHGATPGEAAPGDGGVAGAAPAPPAPNSPDLDEVRALAGRVRKARRTSMASAPVLMTGEPWTAIGTVLDADSLQSAAAPKAVQPPTPFRAPQAAAAAVAG